LHSSRYLFNGRLRSQAPESARRRKHAAEEAVARSDAGRGGAPGALEKNGRAPAKGQAVAHLRGAMGLSERRARQIVAVDRKTVRYSPRRTAEMKLRAKPRDLVFLKFVLHTTSHPTLRL